MLTRVTPAYVQSVSCEAATCAALTNLQTPTYSNMFLQGVNAALQRAKEAADAAAAAEALRYAQLQATKLQDAAHWQQQLDQVGT